MPHQHENYLDGRYVGAFTTEKPFGPHVSKCVCTRCWATFLEESKKRKDEWAANERALTNEQIANRERIIDDILKKLKNEPPTQKTPNPSKIKVGDRVTVHGNHMTEGRVGTVIEMPGPSNKYGGENAQRIEVLLDATSEYEWETIWSDNGRYGWLELVR